MKLHILYVAVLAVVSVTSAENTAGSMLAGERRNAVTAGGIKTTVDEIARLEALLETQNNTAVTMQREVASLEVEVQRAHMDKKKMMIVLNTLYTQLKANGKLYAQREGELKVLIHDAYQLLYTCNGELKKGQKLIEQQSKCAGFKKFQCQNHGRCQVRIDSWDHRLEPFCHCRRGTKGTRCEIGNVSIGTDSTSIGTAITSTGGTDSTTTGGTDSTSIGTDITSTGGADSTSAGGTDITSTGGADSTSAGGTDSTSTGTDSTSAGGTDSSSSNLAKQPSSSTTGGTNEDPGEDDCGH